MIIKCLVRFFSAWTQHTYLFRDFSLFHSETQTRIIRSGIVGKKSYFHKVIFQESRMKLNVAFSFSLVKFSLLEILSSWLYFTGSDSEFGKRRQ